MLCHLTRRSRCRDGRWSWRRRRFALQALYVLFFKQKTAYEIMSGDWSSDVCSSD
eukprot:COSAG01_NODE_73181_length_251_cov_0.500000_1_plen_54_part_10